MNFHELYILMGYASKKSSEKEISEGHVEIELDPNDSFPDAP